MQYHCRHIYQELLYSANRVMIKQNVTSCMSGNPQLASSYITCLLCISMTLSLPPVLVQLSCCIKVYALCSHWRSSWVSNTYIYYISLELHNYLLAHTLGLSFCCLSNTNQIAPAITLHLCTQASCRYNICITYIILEHTYTHGINYVRNVEMLLMPVLS